MVTLCDAAQRSRFSMFVVSYLILLTMIFTLAKKLQSTRRKETHVFKTPPAFRDCSKNSGDAAFSGYNSPPIITRAKLLN